MALALLFERPQQALVSQEGAEVGGQLAQVGERDDLVASQINVCPSDGQLHARLPPIQVHAGAEPARPPVADAKVQPGEMAAFPLLGTDAPALLREHTA